MSRTLDGIPIANPERLDEADGAIQIDDELVDVAEAVRLEAARLARDRRLSIRLGAGWPHDAELFGRYVLSLEARRAVYEDMVRRQEAMARANRAAAHGRSGGPVRAGRG